MRRSCGNTVVRGGTRASTTTTEAYTSRRPTRDMLLKKEHMITLRAVGCTTAEYVGSSGTAGATSSTAVEERDEVVDEEDQPFGDDNNTDECEEVSPNVDGPSSDELPLLFFFDCESTGGSMYTDHMIEVGAKVVAVL